MTKPFVVLACCLALLAAAPARAAEEEIVLAPVSLLGTHFKLGEKGEKQLLDLARAVLAEERTAAGAGVRFLELPESLPDGLAALPERRGSEAADLLAPLAAGAGADGALAFWLEGDPKQEVRMVALLYLPRRIELERFTVSVNLEREPVLLEKGKVQDDAFRGALAAVVERNLARIVPPAPAEDDAAPEEGDGAEPAAEEGIELTPAGEGGLTAAELRIASAFEAGGRGHAARSPPRRIGVLPFSRSLRSEEKVLRARFGPELFEADLQALAEQAVTVKAEVKRLDGPTYSFNQLEAPRITIDHRNDPAAKLKRLARVCRDAGVDALLIGDLREEDGAGSPAVMTHLWLFLADAGVIERVSWPWPEPPGRQGLERSFAAGVADAFSKTGITPPREGVEYRVRSKDTLFSIARRCYRPDEPGRVVDALARINHLPNRDHIRAGAVLLLPDELEGVELRKACR